MTTEKAILVVEQLINEQKRIQEHFSAGSYQWLDAEGIKQALTIAQEAMSVKCKTVKTQELREKMYHAAFEEDNGMQIWNSGLWIRYKLFEQVLDGMEEQK